MQKNCLIIDNEDQTSSIESIEREAKRKGLSIKCSQFNVGSTEREDLLTEGKIDIDKVMNTFNMEFSESKFHLIAFDWQLDDESINGVELIRIFDSKKVRKNTPKILYSGVLKEEIKNVLDKYKDGSVDYKWAWAQINTLIRINIIDVVDRNDYESSIVNAMVKMNEPIEAIFEAKLREYHKLTFRNTYPLFVGMTLSEIADLIEADEPQGSKFKNELIEQALAYLIDINND